MKMADNNLRQQVEKSLAQANTIRTGNREQLKNVKFRPATTSSFGLNPEVKFRESRSLSEGADLTEGTIFSDDDGETL